MKTVRSSFNDILTDVSPLLVINSESGWYEGWMAAVRYDHAGRRECARRHRRRQQRPGSRLHAGRQPPAPAERERPLPGRAVERAADHAVDGRVQLPPAVRLPLVLGVQPVHGLGLPALRAAVHGGFAGEFAEGRLAFLSSIAPCSGPAGTGPAGPGGSRAARTPGASERK
jgi:hypothetical protein